MKMLKSIIGQVYISKYVDNGFIRKGRCGLMQMPRTGSKPEPVVVGKVGVDLPGKGSMATTTVNGGMGLSDEFRACVPFYLPLAFFWLMFIQTLFAGGDDAISCGLMVVLLGFIVSVGYHRLELFKGFGLNIGYSVLLSIGLCFLFSLSGAFSLDIEDLLFDFWLVFLLPIILLPAILPVRLHLDKSHIRAMGAAYAMPISMFIIMFGLLVGIFGW